MKFGHQKNTKIELYQVIKAILYRLKTGCQWRELPMNCFFHTSYHWQSVYHHFWKWSHDGSWENMWRQLLDKHRRVLDMSSIQLDGTHTPVKRGGEAVGYQGRKKLKTSNLLIITDNIGIPVACSNPAFKSILIRFETKSIHWKSFNIIAFIAILLRQL